MSWFRRKPKSGGFLHLAVDRHGNKYTEHCFSENGDPWRGATILTTGVIDRLRRDGLLPLQEIVIDPTEEGAP